MWLFADGLQLIAVGLCSFVLVFGHLLVVWLFVELSIYLQVFQMFFFYWSFCPLKKTLTSYKFYYLVVFSPAFFIAIDGTELYFFCFVFYVLGIDYCILLVKSLIVI